MVPFFRQDRVTKGGHIFSISKFRTMFLDDDVDPARLNFDATRTYFKMQDDPRVTKVVRFLRHYSLDELPQLWNVIRGDLTLVGPRPLWALQIDSAVETFQYRHEVRAGVTGWWQVNGRSGVDVDEELRMDSFYIENWSFVARPVDPATDRPRRPEASGRILTSTEGRSRSVSTTWRRVLMLILPLVLSSAAVGCAGEREELDLTVADAGVVRTFEVRDRLHVEGSVHYEQTPPVGGNHSSAWQRCGFYSEFIAPERGVHSLEHGAVWITYHPQLPSREVRRLRQLAGENDHVLVSRWDDTLAAPVVASAWGRQMRLLTATDPKLEEFIREFAGGRQAPEQGVPC